MSNLEETLRAGLQRAGELERLCLLAGLLVLVSCRRAGGGLGLGVAPLTVTLLPCA